MEYVTLGSIVSIKGGKRLPAGVSLSKEENDHPYIRIRDLNNVRMLEKTEDFEYVDDETQKSIARYIVDKGDIVISIVGTIGLIAIVGDSLHHANLTENCVRLTDISKDYDSLFLYYYLASGICQDEIKKSTVGAVQPKLPLKNIAMIPVPKIDLQNQKRIARILSSLDDKIELNNQINRNLEEQEKAIFKSWFVDFEPFQNGRFVDSELGQIPKGWQIGHFSDVITSTVCGDWGKDSPTGNYTEEVYCIRGADIPEVNAGNKGKMPLRYILPKNLKTKRLSAGDIVVEISGGSPTQSTGRSALISDALLSRYKREMICTNFCRAITPKKGYSFWASVLWKSFYSSSVFFQYENGTTGIKNLDLGGFIENEPIIIPPQEIAMTFEELGNGFVSTIFGNGLESEHLSMIRDTLLPKLMSGEVYLKETTYGK